MSKRPEAHRRTWLYSYWPSRVRFRANRIWADLPEWPSSDAGSDIRHAGVSKPLECYGRCVESHRDILQPILVVAFTQQVFEIECPYFGTDALSRFACITHG